ncbi:kinase-like domain-containing protein [Mycena pura]|uniref:Kinase-like domain-containing protein n=1 Tax=Mycena pura TaxID=153505 RepID=A0AAD7E5K8_9AGAR|nr:kinase-like domain-containing protein [Mycena pura]
MPNPQCEVDADQARRLRTVLRDLDPDCTNFHIIETNSYGTIYRAHHQTVKMIVAVKVVRCDRHGPFPNTYTSDRDGQPKDFSILQSIVHPNVLEILNVYRSSTSPMTNIISEYMGGGTLLDYIRNEYQLQLPKRIDLSHPGLGIEELTARDIMYQLCQGMGYVHRLGVVHRNLKPENILLTGDKIPFIKIGGFGLAARITQDRGKLTAVTGSLDYMAPEVLHPAEPGYDQRADSWSAGIIFFELLILEKPYVYRPRAFPELVLPALRWETLRDGRLSDDGASSPFGVLFIPSILFSDTTSSNVCYVEPLPDATRWAPHWSIGG